MCPRRAAVNRRGGGEIHTRVIIVETRCRASSTSNENLRDYNDDDDDDELERPRGIRVLFAEKNGAREMRARCTQLSAFVIESQAQRDTVGKVVDY